MSGVEEQGAKFQGPESGPRFRRFGLFGPAYEILSIGPESAHILVVESGEEFDYPISKLRDDPEA